MGIGFKIEVLKSFWGVPSRLGSGYLIGSADSLIRALSGRLEFTVRSCKFKKDSPLLDGDLEGDGASKEDGQQPFHHPLHLETTNFVL